MTFLRTVFSSPYRLRTTPDLQVRSCARLSFSLSLFPSLSVVRLGHAVVTVTFQREPRVLLLGRL